MVGRRPRIGLIVPKRVAGVLDAMMLELSGKGDEGTAAIIAANAAQTLLEELRALDAGWVIGEQFNVRGLNTMRECDAVIALPTTPNIGEANEDADFLGLDRQQHIDNLAAAELEQELGRVRPLDATPENPKIMIYVGPAKPSFWQDGTFDTFKLPAGGPVPSAATDLARAWAEEVLDSLDVVSAALLRHLALRPDWVERLGLRALDEAEMELMRDMPDKKRQRAVKSVIDERDLARVTVASPVGGSRWSMFECQSGAAEAVVAALRGDQPGSDTTEEEESYSSRVATRIAAVTASVAAAPSVSLMVHAEPDRAPEYVVVAVPGGRADVLPIGAIEAGGDLIRALSAAALVVHEATTTLEPLIRLGLRPGTLFDVYVASKLIDGGRNPDRAWHSLTSLYERNGGGSTSPDVLAETEALAGIATALTAELEGVGLTQVMTLEMEALPAICTMQANGLPIDADAWEAGLRAAETEFEELSNKLRGDLGVDDLDDEDAVLKALWARKVPVGSLSDEDLRPYENNPPVAAYKRCRRLRALTRGDGPRILAQARGGDGRARASWDPIGTRTGRVTCTHPALTNLPKVMRSAVQASGGRALVRGDVNAADLRALAAVTGDQAQNDAFLAKRCPHRDAAALLFGKHPAAVTDKDRELGKLVNLGIVNGMGAKRLSDCAAARGLVLTPGDARAVIRDFLASHPGIAKWRAQIEAEQPAVVRTLSGRIRYLDGPKASLAQRLNTPLQGTVADGMKAALALLHARLDTFDAKLVLLIHDEVLVECPVEVAGQVRDLVVAAVKEGMGRFLGAVPVEVDVDVRATWRTAGTK